VGGEYPPFLSGNLAYQFGDTGAKNISAYGFSLPLKIRSMYKVYYKGRLTNIKSAAKAN
jgi:hypothetical protein